MATTPSQSLLPVTLDLHQLPDDAPTLKGMIVELAQDLQQQRQHADHLQARLDQLLRRMYGRRSERLDPAQLSLFADQRSDPSAATAAQQTPEEDKPGRPRRGAHGRQRLPEHLPREVIRIELTEVERLCPCCGQQRQALGEEVSEQLEYVPASVLVKQHVRVTYFCCRCQSQPQPSSEADTTMTDETTAASLPASPTVSSEASGASTASREQTAGSLTTASADEAARLENHVAATLEVHQQELPCLAEGQNGVPSAEAVATDPALQVAGAESDAVARNIPGGGLPIQAVAAGTTLVADNRGSRIASGACSTFITAPMPPQAIPRCLAGPGLLAHVIVSKFVDHLPLYRQEQQFLREGVWLSRRTLCDWLAGCARALEPLFTLLWQRVFQARHLHTDDTSVCVQGQTGKGRLWVYVGDSAHPYTVYDFTRDRSAARPAECLASFRGHLQADGYGVYDGSYNAERIEVGCWAHARRYFYDARATDPVRACYVLSNISRMYTLEAAAKYAWQVMELSNEDYWDVRQQLRQRQAVPLLDKLWDFLTMQQPQVLPRSPIGEAFTYLRNQWTALRRYVEHGFLDIDNNVAEQALRAIAVGRKNWLFLGSAEGGRTAAILYSMVQSCKRHGVEPWLYLREVLTILPTLSEFSRATELPKLLPDEWARLQRQSHGGTDPPRVMSE